MDIRFLILTVGGLGHVRPAPGTWGSMPPVVLAALLIALGLGPVEAPIVYNGVFLAVVVVFSLACAAFGDRAEARFWRKDPWQVVADETAGQSIALMLLPAAALATPAMTAFTLIYCFLAFRLFDIIKPFPAYRLQLLPGGWGILVDDLLAGVYAFVFVQAVARILL